MSGDQHVSSVDGQLYLIAFSTYMTPIWQHMAAMKHFRAYAMIK